MGPLFLLACALSATPGPAPILLDPRAARDEPIAPGAELRAAEIALLTGAPEKTLELAGTFAPKNEGERARAIRLELDAHVALGQRGLAEQRIAELAKYDGWGAHAARQTLRLDAERLRGMLADAGMLAFALALGFSVLAGARELLRFSRESIVFAAAAVAAIAIARTVSPVAANAVGLSAIATLALVHASVAATKRLLPGPRGRLLILALLAFGAIGAAAAVLARLDVMNLAAVLSL